MADDLTPDHPDVVSDLPTEPVPTLPARTETHEAPSWTAPEADPDLETSPKAKRWPKRVAIGLIIVLAGAAGGLGYLAYENQQRAADWEAIAVDTQAELDDTEEELDDTEDELAETQAELAAADDRISELATEKAQVATEREFFQTQQELFTGLSLIGDDAITSMTNCLSAQGDVTSAVFGLNPGDPFFYSALAVFDSALERASSICGNAASDVVDFRGLLDELLASL